MENIIFQIIFSIVALAISFMVADLLFPNKKKIKYQDPPPPLEYRCYRREDHTCMLPASQYHNVEFYNKSEAK